ncbi:hypothetical protein [Cellulosimicrobium sp. Marseille-Q4280]|uniref:hypothetical protein n=1 Tax=Cellulosimicrobium sp. Marseille-Q4280 TaxID=2937992 RepID=UPI002041F695|nr:hypothetical protein [Cellulosimicrobium sp. Marseille-Q4280]
MSAWTVAAAATFTPGQVFAQRDRGHVHLWTRGEGGERPWSAPTDGEPLAATDQEIAEAMLIALHGAGLPVADVDWAWGLQTRTFTDGPHDSAVETRDVRTMKPYTEQGAADMVERMNGERGQFRPDGARLVRQLVGAWAPASPEPEETFETPHDSLRYALDWAMWGHGMGDTFRGPLIERMLAGVPVADRAQAQNLITDWLARRGGPGDAALFTQLRARIAELEAEVERLREVGMDSVHHLARQMGLALREENRARQVYLRLASTMSFARTLEYLDITDEELTDDVERGNVIMLEVGDEQVFPADQFLMDRASRCAIVSVLRKDGARRQREDWCWAAALFLAAPQPELRGAAPASWLLDGGPLPPVLDAARRVAAAGGPIAAARPRVTGS